MSRYYSYLNSAKQILLEYKGEEPFAPFLKKYFSQHKKYGSKDRKQVSHLCYCYFRLGKSASDLTLDERILLGLFFCSNEPNELLRQLKPAWNDQTSFSFEEKCSMLNAQRTMFNVFPWEDELSEGLDYKKFIESFFVQPGLFLRLRPGKETDVKQKLEKIQIAFTEVLPNCLELPNSSNVEAAIELNREAVIQDYSSQRVGDFLEPLRREHRIRVWDCCAASGGKSIMAKDILGDIDLTVSDIRESILNNLKKRFNEAGIIKYKAFIADLTQPHTPLNRHPEFGEGHLSPFDLIICDAPCTGSGTWSRTPEQLFYFEKEKIARYALLQRGIVSNAIAHLKPGAYFLYITCSVFEKENEEIAEFANKNFDLKIKKMEVLKGYDKRADTMFAALLQKPL